MSLEEQWIWFAGFFDGEGCIAVVDSWRKKKHSNELRYSTTIILHVRQCDKAPLDFIQTLTKVGKVSERKMPKDKPNWRKQYQWQVGGNNQVKKILRAIQP